MLKSLNKNFAKFKIITQNWKKVLWTVAIDKGLNETKFLGEYGYDREI